MSDKVYDIDNIPEDAELFTGQGQEFDPIDPGEIYQVMIEKVDLQDNFYYKPDAEKAQDRGDKYSFSFQYIILNEGEFYGRRLWDSTSMAFKADGKRGPTKLYKIVNTALQKSMTPEDVAEYAPDMKTFLKHLKEDITGLQVKVSIENIENAETKKVRTKVVSYSKIKSELPEYDAENPWLKKIADKSKAKASVKKADEKKPAKSEGEPEDEKPKPSDIPF